jgi:coronin-1B/1C/6
MSRIVRTSKYRHVFGKEFKPELTISNVESSQTTWDTNYMACNNTFWAVLWQTGGGGSVAVVPMATKGKLPQADMPLINGHKNAVLDLDFNPFNDYILATASEDSLVKIWSIPSEGLKQHMTEPVQTLKGHTRKVGQVKFNPTAANVLASTSTDYSVKIWDVATGQAKLSVSGPTDIIQSLAWSSDGQRLAITSKDKLVRVADPRTGKFEVEKSSHDGVKGSRVVWVDDKVFTVGFAKGSDREYKLFDAGLNQIVQKTIDNSSGQFMPFYDEDTKMIYLVGKGDTTIRYYEYTGADEYIYALDEFKSTKSNKGGCFMYKTGLNIGECEVARFLKLEASTNKVVPIALTVPRKSDHFQDDIFPDTASGAGEAALTTADYFAGKNAAPKKVSLQTAFVAKPKQEEVFVKQEVDDGPQTVPELKTALDDAKKRIAYLEAELVKARAGK